MSNGRQLLDKRLVTLVAALSAACATMGTHLVGPAAAPAVGAGPGADPAESIVHSLFLLGDAGWVDGPDALLTGMAALVADAPRLATVVFLGDNVYQAGLPAEGAPNRAAGEETLRLQADVALAGEARAIFVPGNHDWDRSGPNGWDAVLRQARFVEGMGAEFSPGGGCPGPAVTDLGDDVRLVALDTEWWLRVGSKPEHPDSDCPADSESEVLDALGAALASAGDRHTVVVAHHPLATTGPHGGYFTWKDHLFPLRRLANWLWIPLPIVGSAYPLLRRSGITEQDMSGPRNRQMRAALDSVLSVYNPLVYAAGHEHGLQVLDGLTARHLLVSGGGSMGHLGPVGRESRTRFAQAAAGFMRIEFTNRSRARLGVFVVQEDGMVTEDFSLWLVTQ
jgi:hypothetical protein